MPRPDGPCQRKSLVVRPTMLDRAAHAGAPTTPPRGVPGPGTRCLRCRTCRWLRSKSGRHGRVWPRRKGDATPSFTTVNAAGMMEHQVGAPLAFEATRPWRPSLAPEPPTCGGHRRASCTRDRNGPVAESLVRRMCGAIKHRGPDDEGLREGAAGLGMRRLSIIDLSAVGSRSSTKTAPR